MLHDAFIEFFVIYLRDRTYFDLFDLFIGNVSAADIILIFREVDYLLMTPESVFRALSESDPFFELF